MQLDYQLAEPDILTHQLFILSQSKSFQRRRARGRMFLLLIYMITGMFIWQRNGPVTAALFYVICFPLYFLYRRMEARQYEKHISNYVHEQFKDSFQQHFTLQWDDTTITSTTGSNKHNLAWLELESVTEISALVMLNFRNNQSILLPKNKIAELPLFLETLEEKANSLGVPYDRNLSWKWS
ncbi:MAG TPA: hypothetical protein VJ508_06100 [Saprospiraceae bacterium]|nr:hypothetical protein [Saprospiraceae bacterium]